MKTRLCSIVVLLLFVVAGSVFAQAITTATLEGKVVDSDGMAVPGVTVTAKSPALQGERSAVSTATGDYVMRGLPPGQYTVRFTLEGMQTVNTKVLLSLGLPSRADATMKVAAIAEAITVTATTANVLETSTVGANVKAETVQDLPVVRTPTGIASLAAGVTDRTPVAGQLSINGGMAYDNLLLINGVNFQDSVFGNTNNLFVEDSIQETQVLTSGISAEYGHFTGGVLNVITKSGGNEFTGSIRDNVTKPSWLALSPYDEGFRGVGVTPGKKITRTGKLSNVWELTFGGPIVKDRLWFFLAGRDAKTATPRTTSVTGIAVTQNATNRRPEGKLTAAIGSNHSVQASYIDNPTDQDIEWQLTPLDTYTLLRNTKRVNHGWTAAYTGVLSSSVFVEGRYSEKVFGFRNFGGSSKNIIDSPIWSASRFPGNSGGVYNGPYWDATDPEDRNNKQGFAALSYFLSRPSIGSHDIKGGFERFDDIRTGGNSQSSTNYVFDTGYKVDGTTPLFDSNGYLIPVFRSPEDDPSWASVSNIEWWIASRNAKLTTTTDSFFVNDRWNLNSNFTFNIGGRYEAVKAKSTGNIVSVDTNNFVPRLAASYDPLGNGKYKFDVTYAQYVGRYSSALVGANSPVGNPALLYGYYVGPAGEGRNFAPGFDPKNYVFYLAQVPTANVFTAPGLHAPVNDEMTFSGGMVLPKGGWAKVTFTDRKLKQVIDNFITIDQGCTNVVYEGVDVGCADNEVYRNTNGSKRNYQAVEAQARYDLTSAWGVEGNWTHQFKNDGNYEGEGGQSIGTSPYGNRPEIQSPRELPLGRLSQFEADKVRLWTTYRFDLRRAGMLTAGLIYRYDSPLTFSYTASVPRSAQSKALNPGYKNVSSSVTLFFGDRGAGSFNATSLFDLSLQYSLPLFSRLTPWVKFDVRNLLNDDTMTGWNTGIVADSTSAKDALGYPTGYKKGTAFGRPTGAASYTRPREYFVYAGVRF